MGAATHSATPALAANVAHFVRLLRSAGLPVGPGHTLTATQALTTVEITARAQFYWALHGTLVSRREHRHIFDSAFRLFWRDPFGADEALNALLARSQMPSTAPSSPTPPRLVPDSGSVDRPVASSSPEVREVPLRLAWSADEVLRTRDFAAMTAAEAIQVRQIMRSFRLDLRPIPTRRHAPDARGRLIDMRKTLRAGVRTGGWPVPLRRKSPTTRRPLLVALCDISGSMESYSRTLLHFFHALTNAGDPLHTFVFGTRLTNITRLLRDRDVDRALDRVGKTVQDWKGGTRIGQALRNFNVQWSRRLLAPGAVVLLVTDGLDREGGREMRAQARRLRGSCRRLIWLNPLLRYEGFAPRAAGIRALLPEVNEHRPIHNLQSLEQLTAALGKEAGAPRPAPLS